MAIHVQVGLDCVYEQWRQYSNSLDDSTEDFALDPSDAAMV